MKLILLIRSRFDLGSREVKILSEESEGLKTALGKTFKRGEQTFLLFKCVGMMKIT